MKKILAASGVVFALATISSFAQGTINVNNLSNTGVFNGNGGTTASPVYSALVTQNGLFFTTDPTATAAANGSVSQGALMGVDFNFAIYGGATAGTATTLITGLNGGAIAGDNFNYGQLQGPSGTFQVSGTTASSTVYLNIFAWEGNYATYAAAVAANAYVLTTGAFANASGGGINAPVSLTGMPDAQFAVQATPEPGTMALAGLGIAGLLAFRRKK
jgi:hypothetical protein